MSKVGAHKCAPLRCFGAVLLSAVFLVAPYGRSRAAAVPPIVERTAAAYAAEVRGIVGMQRHFITRIKGGPISHTEESDSGFLMHDGSFVRIKYCRVTDDGRAFDAGQLERRDSQTNRDWADGRIFFKEPYDPRYMADYDFEPPQACAGCAAGTVAVNFSSGIRDAQHGSGTMWIDAVNARVARLTYVPNALPPHATSGSVTEFDGPGLPDLWYVTRIESAYRGHIFILTGSGTFIGTFDHFRRFSALTEAEAALQSGTI